MPRLPPSLPPVFSAVIEKGYAWRTFTELMTDNKIVMHLTKEGITIGHENLPLISKYTELTIIAKCDAKNFQSYVLAKNISVSFTTSEHNNFIKNVKKKSSLSIKIVPKGDRTGLISEQRVFDFFLVAFSPDDSESDGLECEITCTETIPEVWESPPDDEYNPPIPLKAINFSQIKVFNQKAGRTTITTQRNPKPTITFSIKSGTTNSLTKKFGTFLNPYPDLKYDKEGYPKCGGCEKYLDECWCECEVCGEYRGTCQCLCPCRSGYLFKDCSECETNPYEIIARTYPLAALLKLTKITGIVFMISEPKLLKPKDEEKPLKISFDAGCQESILGKVDIMVSCMDGVADDPSPKKKK